MENYYTYNKLLKVFKDISDKHYQIKAFSSGQISDINTFLGTEFVKMFLSPQSVTVKESTIIYNVRLFLFDILQSDSSNTDEVISDTIQIAIDVINIFKKENPKITLIGDVELVPFTEAFVDLCAGVYVDLPVEVRYDNGSCSYNKILTSQIIL